MAEAPAFIDDGLPVQWNNSIRPRRKLGCSNIFSGVNVHQLRRLFRTAGDRDAKQRAKLVWRGVDADIEGAEERWERDEREDEAGLARALVGLRVRTRNRAGIRVEGHRDQKQPRASGYVRPEELLSDCSVEDEETALAPSSEEFLLDAEKDIPENQNPFKPSSWRLGSARQGTAQDSKRYLHRILHKKLPGV
ncbi:uncharacterized protein avpi1 [Pleuronectes platessa]|uniref:uncharacterized protein avpi1 n=1 Tax=Pleuronectes platessa TaxID=8262 RepID=UPI00232A7094|nr:uncharacterized protein avpi1 [Pleuronectes platessa]